MRRDKTFPSIEKAVLASLVLSSSLSIATSASAQVLQNVANFNGTNGALPFGSLTLSSNGLFYGTTDTGGTNNDGTIFSFNPATNALTDLANFNGTNGADPRGSLTLGSNGLFYGTTTFGGTNGDGTIFSFNPATNTLTDLANFDRTNGADPNGSLTLGSNGLFYGTTVNGGTTNFGGTIFSFNPINNALTGLADFNSINSLVPTGSLTLSSNGLFYGTTLDGGTNLEGTIFSFDPATGALTDLANFNFNNGGGPDGGLTLGSNGLFYGTTSGGGSKAQGIIFSFDPATNTLTNLVNFNGTNGTLPLGSLTFGSNGLFYGTTIFGGTVNAGTIFSFNPTNNALTKLADFNGTNGAEPSGSLTLGSNGLFYGTTEYGGTSNVGTIFSFDPGISSTSIPEPDVNLALGVTVLGAIAFLKRQLTKATKAEN